MSTLAIMKSRIADELSRSDLTSPIATAISDAISAYQTERFFFNESRSTCVFNTVASQEFYTSVDHASIPDLLAVDYVALTVSNTVSLLDEECPEVLEDVANTGTVTGQPSSYAYYNRTLRLYPVPTSAWSLRIAAQFKIDAPTTDSTPGNAWMVEAERLIRSRAKYELALHWLKDPDMATTMAASVTEALDQLKGRTNKQVGLGKVQPMAF